MEDLDGEKLILYHLLERPAYFNSVFSFLKPSHFRQMETNQLFESISSYFKKYELPPTTRELAIYVNSSEKINPEVKRETLSYIKHEIMTSNALSNYDFLLDYTKNYLKKISLSEAIMDSVQLIKDEGDFTQIISMIEDALKYDFDKDLGSEFFDSALERIKTYKEKFNSIPTGIDGLDAILGGGFRPSTLSVFAGFSHSGKSSIMSSIMCGMAREMKNVLFVTLEMPETDVLKKVDSNLMGINSNRFEDMDENDFIERVKKIHPNVGKIFVKEYSAGEMDVLKLKNLVDELETENKCTIDAIFVDYLGLMKSVRVPMSVGLYSYYKSISEELHGFAKKYKKILITASQLNRSSADNLDAGMEAVSDSLGVVMTADIFINILTNDELKANKQVLLKFEKNRYTGDLHKLLCNVDWSKVRLSAVDGDTKLPEIKGSFDDVEGMEEAVNFSYSEDDFNFDAEGPQEFIKSSSSSDDTSEFGF